MKSKIFVIFDVKAGFYNKPFFMPNTNTAIRAFSDLANDEATEIAKHPSDFSLYELGTYDDSVAKMELIDRTLVCTALETKKERFLIIDKEEK